MRLRVIFLGEDPRDPLQQAAADYLARCGRRFDAGLVPLKPGKRGKNADDDAVRAAEGVELLKASEGCTRIALDKGGQQPSSSESFAASIESLMAKGKPVAFLIGGATGLHASVVEQCFAVWSLSPITFAHRLAVCVLAEQLYRASEIARGGPYHK
ncbi:MAG: 23S rRNA (pseudouridine(1915)-N(3))-methyltransferase RlmH [Deltaproteobacteria bacterium]|nr:23S rRNA (pseudouridine(1915)-N(3))-methyltransferase RlmH [Deltaproteobacteria bacterium]